MDDSSQPDRRSERGLLGDTPSRAYGDKLALFNRFAEPEICQLIEMTGLRRGQRVLDAGCGVGLATAWFRKRVGESGLVVGCDLSGPHLQIARDHAAPHGHGTAFVQCDVATPPFLPDTFDLVWCANTINHLTDPVAGIRRLTGTLRPGGQIALVQSGFLPDMFFAWDERLERAVTAAVRQYYRDKYNFDERDVAGMRGLIGLAQRSGLAAITVQTVIIERTSPLSNADREYLLEAVFNGYWGDRLRPYLDANDWYEVHQLCDPESDAFCLDRPDFHHVQTLTMVVGRR